MCACLPISNEQFPGLLITVRSKDQLNIIKCLQNLLSFVQQRISACIIAASNCLEPKVLCEIHLADFGILMKLKESNEHFKQNDLNDASPNSELQFVIFITGNLSHVSQNKGLLARQH